MDKFSDVQGYDPGDHVGVYPQNEARLVEGIIKYVKDPENADVTYQVEKKAKGKNIFEWLWRIYIKRKLMIRS